MSQARYRATISEMTREDRELVGECIPAIRRDGGLIPQGVEVKRRSALTILGAIWKYPGSSRAEILQVLEGDFGDKTVRRCLRELLELGLVEEIGSPADLNPRKKLTPDLAT